MTHNFSLETTQLNMQEVGKIIKVNDPDAKITCRGVRLQEDVAGIPDHVAATIAIVIQVAANTLTCIDHLKAYAASLIKRKGPARKTYVRIKTDRKRLDLATTDPEIVKATLKEFSKM